jgi:hypothetical protein
MTAYKSLVSLSAVFHFRHWHLKHRKINVVQPFKGQWQLYVPQELKVSNSAFLWVSYDSQRKKWLLPYTTFPSWPLKCCDFFEVRTEFFNVIYIKNLPSMTLKIISAIYNASIGNNFLSHTSVDICQVHENLTSISLTLKTNLRKIIIRYETGNIVFVLSNFGDKKSLLLAGHNVNLSHGSYLTHYPFGKEIRIIQRKVNFVGFNKTDKPVQFILCDFKCLYFY